MARARTGSMRNHNRLVVTKSRTDLIFVIFSYFSSLGLMAVIILVQGLSESICFLGSGFSLITQYMLEICQYY